MLRLLTIAVVSTFLLIPIAGFSSNIIENTALLIFVSFTTGYVIVPAILLQLWPAEKKAQKSDGMYMALMDGNLASREYDVRCAVEIEELEDEGLHYLLELDDDRTLFLSGQYLYDPVARGAFPSSKFTLYWDRKTGDTFGIDSAGAHLIVKKVLPPLNEEDWRAGNVPDDREEMDKSIHEVVKRLEHRTK